MSQAKKRVLVFVVYLINIVYLVWRIAFTIPPIHSVFSLFFVWGLLLAELMGAFELFVMLQGFYKQFVPVLPDVSTADQSQWPDIDVLIATYNEDVSLVRKTILGCKNMAYPRKDAVRIVLCDDGKRPAMRALAHELQIDYLSRNTNEGAKAGNLNNALHHTTAPLLVTFDADMIPLDCFLLHAVPYFLIGKETPADAVNNIGFVQTPQSFYNTDLFQANFFAQDHIPNEQDYFYQNIQTTKNGTNSVIYGGSNTVISRKALQSVGGFYEKSITEDFATGILLQSNGYACYATREVLASGLSPQDVESLLKQRERWARGCIQTIKKLRIITNKKLTIAQKLSYTAAISYWYACVKRFYYIVAPVAFTVFGIRVMRCSLLEVLLIFVPMNMLTNYILRRFSGEMRRARWTNIYETITFPTLLKAVLLETVGISQSGFSVTKKQKQTVRNHQYLAKKSISFYIYLALCAIGIFNLLWYSSAYQTLDFIVILFWLIVNGAYLFMALLFIRGNPHATQTEHYKASLALTLQQGNASANVTTDEIAQEFVRFSSEQALQGFDLQQPITVTVQAQGNYQTYTCAFSAQCAQLKSKDNLLHYQCDIIAQSAQEYDAWCVILHNRVPTTPTTVYKSTLLQDLWRVLKQANQPQNKP